MDYFPTAGTFSPLVLGLIISGNILTAYCGAWLWQHGQARWQKSLGNFCEPLSCAVATLAAPLLAATVGVGAIVGLGARPSSDAPSLWLAWWSSDAIGALFLLPLLLAAPALAHRGRHAPARDFKRAALLLALSAVVVVIASLQPVGDYFLFAFFPLLVFAAAWFDAPGTRVLAFVIFAASTATAALGRGPFATGQHWDDLLSVQLFLLASGLIALFLPPIHARRNLFQALPLTLLLGGWMLSGLLVARLLTAQRRTDAAHFAQQAVIAESAIEHRVVNYVAVLRSAQGFVLGAPAVTGAGWQTFVQSLDLPTNHPGLRGVGLVYPVPPAELENFLARVRADGAPDFTLRPWPGETLARAQPHFVLTYLESMISSDQIRRGLDVGSQPFRRKILEAARDTGQPQIAPHPDRTPPGSGFTLYLPVYALGAPVATVAERRAAFRVWVHAGFSTELLLQGVLGARHDQLDFYLFAFGPLDAAHLIYTTAPGRALPAFDLIHSQRLFGQEFTLAWNRGPAFVPELRTPLILLAVSLAFGTVLLTGWVLSLQSFREQAEVLVAQRTQTLSQSEARYRAVVESSPLLLVIHRGGRVLYVNPAALLLFGATTAADLVGQPILDFVHPDSRSLVQARLESLAATGGATPLAHERFRRFDGTVIEVEARSVTIPYEGASAICSTAEDITARVTTEAALQVSEQRFRDLVNSTDGIVWEADATTFVFTAVSVNAQRLLGYPVAAWLQPGFWAGHIHPDDRDQAVQYCASCTGRAEDHDFEYRFIAADGRVMWLRDIVRVVSENNQPRWLRGLMIDISARKVLEATLRESEQRWRYAIEGAGDGLWDWNVPAQTVFLSPRWKEHLGFAAHEVSDQAEEWNDRVHPDDLARVMAETQRHLDGATPHYSTEYRCRCKDGSWKWILARGLVVARDAAGKPVRMIGTHTDITARRGAEDKLRLSEARLTTLFEFSPYAIWDEDFSAVRAYFDQRRAAGVTDFRAHFSAHPDDVVQCAGLVKIRAINNQTLRILEAPSKAEVVLSVPGYFTATSMSVFREELITLAEGGSFYAGDIPLLLPSGRHIVCAFHLAVVPGAEQTLEQVLFTFEDVTARRRFEQEQRETAMQLGLVIRGGDIGYWDWNFVTGGLVVNNRWLTILGLDPHGTPLCMELWNSLLHPEDVPQFVRQVQAVILNPAGSSGEVEIRARHTAGHYVWILDKFSVVARADDGSPLRVVGTHLDITARKQAEAALRTSEARAHAIINASPVPMALNDLAGNFTFLNPAFTQTFGYELADIPTLGDWWPQAYPDPAYRQQVVEASQQELARSAQTGTAFAPLEQLIRCKDGTERYVVIGAAILVSAFSHEHLVVLHNITERHTAESALHDSLAEKTALLKEVHHRVKNNLQVITSLLRLESGRSVVPTTKAVLTEMQNRIRAMALLHDFLYRTGNFAAIDLGAYIEKVATQSFRMLNAATSLVRLTLDLRPIPVEMEQAALCGLLVNELISNCLKHGFPVGRSGEVRIELQPGAGRGQICLRVSDDGVGLPPDFATRRGQSLGLQLVGDLSEQLNATLVIGPEPSAVFALTFTPTAVKLPAHA